MKRKGLFILAAVFAMTFLSCEKEEPLTENPEFVASATGDDPNGDGSGNPNGGGTGGGGTGGGGTGGGGTGGGGSTLTLTDTMPSNRVAVLEDFTGVRCQFCPSGAQVAQAIEQQLGDDFITIATHGGSFATPGTVNVIIPGGDTVQMFFADFRTQFSDALISQANVAGYPAGTMNRIRAANLGVTAQNSGGYAMSRNHWSNAASAVNNLTSPVNIGALATVSGNTLTVKVELYYTELESDDNHINVALLQDEIESIQISYNGSAYLDTAYPQNHTLRHYLTGQWGDGSDLDGTKAKGYIVTKTYTYTIPSEFHASSPTPAKSEGVPVINDMKVVAFVSRGQVDILNAVEVDIQ